MATTLETVTSLYKNTLGRTASSEEIAYWTQRIDSGTESVIDVVWAFTSSSEAVNNVTPVVKLYFAAFGRAPDSLGLQYWVAASRAGMSFKDIATAFTQSSEFVAKVGVDQTAFLSTLYQNTFGRTPDTAGLSYWTNQLANGVSLGEILSAVSSSLESQVTLGAKTSMALAFNGTLGRAPTQEEMTSVLQSQGDKSIADLVKDMADSLLTTGAITPVTPPTEPTPNPVPEPTPTPNPTPTPTPEPTPTPTPNPNPNPNPNPDPNPEPTTPTFPAEATYTPNAVTTAGSSDASTAIALDDKYMIVADDEGNVLRVYDRSGGNAVLEWDYSEAIGSDGEVDLEAAVMVGDILYLSGSHSNTKKGVDADSREVLFSVKVSGTGAATTFTYQGKQTGLEAALVAWDKNAVHGKEPGYFGFEVSSAAGISPENTNGFSIEGMTTSVDGSVLWLGFRAPQTDTGTRDKALIVGVANYKELLNGAATEPVFSEAIELNLGGRGIRSIDKAADGSGYLIIAGPSGSASAEVIHDFRLFTWDGNPSSQPIQLDNDLDTLLASTGGSFESIVSVASIKPGTQIQLLQDNGDTIWPGQTEVSKDLKAGDQQFKGNAVILGSALTDAAAPVLVKASPADEGTGVPVKGALTLTFDEGVAFGTGSIELQKADGTVVESFAAGSRQVKVDYNTITLQPSADLASLTEYKLVIKDDAVTDHWGNTLAAKDIGFSTGEVLHHSVLISEVSSDSVTADFFELYNYGSTAIDLSGWRMNDEAATFSDAIALPDNLILEAGKSLVVVLKQDALSTFKTAWNLGEETQVVAINGPGLGKQDAVVLFDSQGNVATAFNYDESEVLASDGSSIPKSPAGEGFTFVDEQHTGAAYGGKASASAIWDGQSTLDPHYIAAVQGVLGSYKEEALDSKNKASTAVGSPGIVEVVEVAQSGALVASEPGLIA